VHEFQPKLIIYHLKYFFHDQKGRFCKKKSLKKFKFFGALTNRWWSGTGWRTWKAFFSSTASFNYPEKVKKFKKKI
jgi:hypothetical protein